VEEEEATEKFAATAVPAAPADFIGEVRGSCFIAHVVASDVLGDAKTACGGCPADAADDAAALR
jgi:hypothetical protein